MRRWLIGVAAAGAGLAVIILITLNDDEPTPAPRTDVDVTVDLDLSLRTRGSLNGFIHSLDATTPAEERVAPLAPRLWRSDGVRAPIDRATGFGADYQLVLSDLWGYPQSDWNGRGPPWRDLPAWERFVRRAARTYGGGELIWDIWNEPNDPGFWSGGRRRFLEVYSRANRVLRDELGPEVEIAGPSTSRYTPALIAELLDHCLRAGCRIETLSWHENLEPDELLSSISRHLADARRRFLDDPRFAPLGLREIHINEYKGRSDRYLPGDAVSYLDQLERGGGANRAALSCWSREDCAPAGLDGLLAAGGEPRPVWWAHRWYAAGSDARVRSETSDPRIPVLSASEPGRAEVLLGYAPAREGPRHSEPAERRVALTLRGGLLQTASRAQVSVEAVRGSSVEAPQPSPRLVQERTLEPKASGLRLILPELRPHEAMLVTIEAR